jgi:hypothetical protein
MEGGYVLFKVLQVAYVLRRVACFAQAFFNLLNQSERMLVAF